MITDKDREEARVFCEKIKVVQSVWVNGKQRPDEVKQIFNTSENIENVAGFIARIRTESAEQARKEAADRAVEWIMKRIVPGVFADILVQDIRFSILTDADTNKKDDHIPDIGEKLAIAVKALEYVVSKGMPSNVFESQYSRLQDACTTAGDALKEIQV